jgi:thiamine pyrophosphate-dependent acetolactate synthase large subunit-like protein
MKRSEVMTIIARYRKGAPAVAGPGATSGTLWASGHDPATIYNMEMGYSIPICFGVAQARPDQKVLALEGEGSAILGLSALATIGRYQPRNLVAIVFDNGVYGTGGGTIETGTRHGTDIAAVARACGIEESITVTDLNEAERVISRAFDEVGPWFLVMVTEPSDTRERPRPGVDHVEAAYAFRNALNAKGLP